MARRSRGGRGRCEAAQSPSPHPASGSVGPLECIPTQEPRATHRLWVGGDHCQVVPGTYPDKGPVVDAIRPTWLVASRHDADPGPQSADRRRRLVRGRPAAGWSRCRGGGRRARRGGGRPRTRSAHNTALLQPSTRGGADGRGQGQRLRSRRRTGRPHRPRQRGDLAGRHLGRGGAGAARRRHHGAGAGVDAPAARRPRVRSSATTSTSPVSTLRAPGGDRRRAGQPARRADRHPPQGGHRAAPRRRRPGRLAEPGTAGPGPRGRGRGAGPRRVVAPGPRGRAGQRR